METEPTNQIGPLECPSCYKTTANGELRLQDFKILSCNHVWCHFCISKSFSAHRRSEPETQFVLKCPLCRTEHYEPQPELLIDHKTSGSEQSFNFEFGKHNHKHDVINILYKLFGENTGEKYIKDCLIIVHTIDEISILVKLSKKQTLKTLREVFPPGFYVNLIKGQINFETEQAKLSVQGDKLFVRRLQYKTSNAETRSACQEIAQDLRNQGLL